jgi:hypothetical protein
VQVRVYSPAAAVAVTVSAPLEARGSERFFLGSGGALVHAAVAPGQSRRVSVLLAGRTAMLVSTGSAHLPDGRTAGVHLDWVEPSK